MRRLSHPPLSGDDYRVLALMLDLIDRLAARGGWDPAEMIDPRTNQTFAPVLERTRAAVRSYEASRAEQEQLASPRRDCGIAANGSGI